MTITAEARSNFRDDQRGAVMLTGLFMSFVLVGALWYVIGVGDAIIFRDRMQEAADHAAFSSAALHAKGMNFISAINIVMMILVAVHIIFGLIQDATIATCLAAGLGCISCFAACPKIPGAIMDFHDWSDRVKKGLKALSNLETGIAIGAPWIGTAKGYTVGGEYKKGSGRVQGNVNVFAIGPSNLFANGGKGIIGMSPGTAVPVGLPVSGEKYSFLCSFLAQKLFSSIGEFIGIDYLGKILGWAGKFAGVALKFRYCNDLGSGESYLDDTKEQIEKAKKGIEDGSLKDAVENQKAKDQAAADKAAGKGDGSYQPVLPGLNGDKKTADQINTDGNGGKRDDKKKVNGWSPWFDPGFDKGWGDPGVLVTIGSAGNGNQPTRIWAVAVNPQFKDMSERRVSTGANVKARAWKTDTDQGSQFIGWVAESEFYYDCEEKWDKEDCDGEDHLASFGIRWRARLRKVQLPNFLQILTDMGSNKLGDVIKEKLGKALEGNPVGKLIAESKVGAVGIDILGETINNMLVKPILDTIKKGVDGATDGITDAIAGAVFGDMSAHH